jgi:hypothetical protein
MVNWPPATGRIERSRSLELRTPVTGLLAVESVGPAKIAVSKKPNVAETTPPVIVARMLASGVRMVTGRGRE